MQTLTESRARLLSLLMAVCIWPSIVAAQGTSCSPEERRESLRQLQAQVLQLVPNEVASLDDAIRPGGRLAGYRMTHGHVVMAHTGAVPVGNRRVNPYKAELPMPQLLQYAPSSASDPRRWLDFDGEDGPYRLIGWAYLAPFDPAGPPMRRCVDPSEWFVHDAGWHLMDGGMHATPDATAEPPRPQLPAGINTWHEKQWDLHVWIEEDGVPSISFANPRASGVGYRLPDWVSYYLVNGKKQLPPAPRK